MSATSLTAPSRTVPRRPPLEIVTTRTQRRSRPRAAYAIATVAGVFVILLMQLLLSIVLSDGAYRLTALDAQRIELDRTAQVLTERLNVYDSAQNVASQAEMLGMVVSTVSPAFLLLADGSVQGAPMPAEAGSGMLNGRETLVGNVLLAGLPLVAIATAGVPATGEPGVPSSLPGSGVSAPAAGVDAPLPAGALPSPVTR